MRLAANLPGYFGDFFKTVHVHVLRWDWASLQAVPVA